MKNGEKCDTRPAAPPPIGTNKPRPVHRVHR
jgi:hypothetical protein